MQVIKCHTATVAGFVRLARYADMYGIFKTLGRFGGNLHNPCDAHHTSQGRPLGLEIIFGELNRKLLAKLN